MMILTNTINKEDISIVVQGPIDDKNFMLVYKSIRMIFPLSRIIISTWEGQDIKITDNNTKIIFNADPGAYKDTINKNFTNNLLRHIVSSLAGLMSCNTKYVLRMRSDLLLQSDDFIKYYNIFDKRNSAYKLFEKRIITSTFFSKKFLSYRKLIHPVPFHISDWIHFGLLEDLIEYYSSTVPKEPEQSHYFDDKFLGINKVNLLHSSHQYAPEQFLLSYLAYKKFNVKFDHYLDYNRYNILESEKIIANNFIIISPYQFKFYCTKQRNGNDRYRLWSKYPFLIPSTLRRGLYTYREFTNDYKKYMGQ
ncbi:WavE lipopolysaccharide synthesis family protein [uncultured Desulfovibrio sp.]|uniref:WavE lipopolysaccharide synthesis family protein n=1 Tax=uncultured Desulfovibrio sp. TaxID=167968 RepID=UPI002711D557|nr:WavE lipopolysaccharide synthesis family protein [uncultured Desulfovibrio sp.]